MIMYDLKALTKTENHWPGCGARQRSATMFALQNVQTPWRNWKIKKKEVFKHIGREQSETLNDQTVCGRAHGALAQSGCESRSESIPKPNNSCSLSHICLQAPLREGLGKNHRDENTTARKGSGKGLCLLLLPCALPSWQEENINAGERGDWCTDLPSSSGWKLGWFWLELCPCSTKSKLRHVSVQLSWLHFHGR